MEKNQKLPVVPYLISRFHTTIDMRSLIKASHDIRSFKNKSDCRAVFKPSQSDITTAILSVNHLTSLFITVAADFDFLCISASNV